MLYFRHKKIRQIQKKFIDDIIAAINNHKVLLAHAETGLGKTDAVISSAILNIIDNGTTLFFLTPKISQHKIAVDVVDGLTKKYDLPIRAVDIIGRKYACSNPDVNFLGHDSFYYTCEKKRKNETCEYYRRATGYSKIEQTMANNLFKKILDGYGSVKTHKQIIQIGEKYKACPYEIMTKLMPYSNIIIADYYHFMIPSIREILLKKAHKKIEDLIVIIDEAHNLAKRVRGYLSSSLNSIIVKNAEKEIKQIGVRDVQFYKAYKKWIKYHMPENGEKIVDKTLFLEFIESIGEEVDDFYNLLINSGNAYLELGANKSNLLKFASFIEKWKDNLEGAIYIIKKHGDFESFSKRYLDPASSTNILNETYASVLMSGTLLPLGMNRDILGIKEEKAMMRVYPSPFNPDNSIHIISTKFSTKYSERTPENIKLIAEEIDKIINVSKKGVAVFFPSYNLMNKIVVLLKSKPLIVQKQKSTPMEVHRMIEKFKGGGILCAVQGGSLSEGIDYNNGEIKTAIIVGLALEEPTLETKALIKYYDQKFGLGWEYGYIYPAISKAIQAAGRGQRKEDDKIAVVYIDARFNWKKYKDVLIYGNKRSIVTENPELYVKNFWRNG